jgi:flagellar biosynthesis protein FlhB
MAMSRNRMMADVPTADVIMANPTHVAVAPALRPAKGAPRVVAKGAGDVAAKIRSWPPSTASRSSATSPGPRPVQVVRDRP